MAVIWILSDHRYLAQRMPAALIDWLAAQGVASRCVVADDHVVDVDASTDNPWRELAPGDVVVARTRDPFGLALLGDAARPGVAVLMTRETVDGVRDKSRMGQALAAAGIPAPPTFLASRPALLATLPNDRFPLLLKPNLGNNARDIVFVSAPGVLADVPWDGDVVVAQSYVECGGWDLKVYGVGEDTWCVRRPSPLADPDGASKSHPVEMTPELADLARRCRQIFGLDLYGIDVLDTGQGLLVVDVNEFPNYTGVADAPDRLGALVVDRLGRPSAGEAAA